MSSLWFGGLTMLPCRVARNLKLFETWSTFQGCEQVAFSDLPSELKADVTEVFDVDRRLPLSWVDEVRPLSTLCQSFFSETLSRRRASSARCRSCLQISLNSYN